jgi:hypothetical protein
MSKITQSLFLGLLALSLAGCTAATTGSGVRAADGNWGPAIRAPQVYMTDTGDRVGHYAPYFYPDGAPSNR